MLRRVLLSGFVSACVVAAGCGSGEDSENTDAAGHAYLFVQSATEGTYRAGALTLAGIAPTTTWFTSRPDRQSGDVPHDVFIESWSQSADSFAEDPPNAGLVFTSGGEQSVAVVELTEPSLTNGEFRYRIRVLDGEVPESFSDVAVFIDSGGLMQLVAYGAQDVPLN
ncbi:hypothetical protein [Hoyosella altamirensis]|uniref:Uncharacterized protein n=1 Tax=Hoyosella altamirensis TaxID=616997 RepID=A0A839RMX3_9ACTN|nr:hypothetical protein [Hoyosella altamirensis]MBB3037363.1 hypothetical protein [Hoyosella altamirensis]